LRITDSSLQVIEEFPDLTGDMHLHSPSTRRSSVAPESQNKNKNKNKKQGNGLDATDPSLSPI
jgi:hypothetical protein